MRHISWSAGTLIVLGTLHVAAQQPAVPVTPAPGLSASVAKTSAAASKLLPGTRPDVFAKIQGTALNSANGTLPNAFVRLRDARFGRIVDGTISDKSGLFAFRVADPGSYVIELVSPDQSSILAASQILNLNAGDIVSAVVKLPFRIPPFAGLLGHTTPSAAVVTSQAAASGVLATTVTQSVSPAR